MWMQCRLKLSDLSEMYVKAEDIFQTKVAVGLVNCRIVN